MQLSPRQPLINTGVVEVSTECNSSHVQVLKTTLKHAYIMFASIISNIAGHDRPKQHAGHTMQRVHSDALSKNDPRYKQ
jgi:hypothetical protein